MSATAGSKQAGETRFRSVTCAHPSRRMRSPAALFRTRSGRHSSGGNLRNNATATKRATNRTTWSGETSSRRFDAKAGRRRSRRVPRPRRRVPRRLLIGRKAQRRFTTARRRRRWRARRRVARRRRRSSRRDAKRGKTRRRCGKKRRRCRLAATWTAKRRKRQCNEPGFVPPRCLGFERLDSS